ncbi:titin-like, partial [Odontomachus brunneus]|uniref:titin-like n=1 Tax=Odontomachus brunneus TaxID=486640 RepID=UPI0013F2A9EF
ENELRDELWFIEFGRGAALPLTPEEAPADGEPVVPCAQGRVVVETARPAPPHFATCSSYRRPLLSRASNNMSIYTDGTAMSSSSSGVTTNQQEHLQQLQQQQQQALAGGKGAVSRSVGMPQSPAMRPEDLGVTPWYLDDYLTTADTSPGPMGDRSSYPSYLYADRDGRLDLNGSTRNSSVDGELKAPPPPPPPPAPVPRKAYMDLRDAMALLDETCPNIEPSPSLTPRTPRTPLTPYSRNKRARSKSSDNSSNYSNDRLSDRSSEASKEKDKEKDKKRPFLRKIGISKTEDRPFLAKWTPRIKGKPYLEKIGPSKAVERPFLDKIGSSKTLDKFTFDTPRNERRNEVRHEKRINDVIKRDEIGNDTRHEIERYAIEENVENIEVQETSSVEEVQHKSSITPQMWATCERRRSGKEFLLKMHSFETEDLQSTVLTKELRDPLRGLSLDDVLDSGPSSLPTENSDERESRTETESQQATGGAELLRCRVITSEEIISSACLDSPGEANSWSNSPRRAQRMRKESVTPVRRRIHQTSREILRSDDSMPNSPSKRPISSVSPDREVESRSDTLERGSFSPTKTRKLIVEDMRKIDNTRRSFKYNQFERRGISSDNLLAKDALSFVTASRTITDDIGRTREISSEDSLAARRGVQEYTRETFKQLQDKFKLQEIPTESYAAFKRRTRAAQGSLSHHERLKMSLLPGGPEVRILKNEELKAEYAPTTDAKENEPAEIKRDQSPEGTVKSVLRKQERIDQTSEQETDTNASIRRPKRRIFHEPSQETMDLLTELRKVKSLLKTPSWEKIDLELQKPARMPKRILLTDKEFCLSVERENSVRRPSRIINSLGTTEEGKIASSHKEQEAKGSQLNETEKVSEQKSPGPALFEKKCMSLDYADEDKPHKPETRAISLASTRNLPSEADDLALMYCKSYSSDLFNSPSEETPENEDEVKSPEEESQESELQESEPQESEPQEREPQEREPQKRESPEKKPSQNHCAEVDIAIPIDQKITSPKGEDVQGRTSDLYEIISPRSTPFRVKKRLGKISVEESVKPENFTLGSKVDCRSVVAQKRTKCFPL